MRYLPVARVSGMGRDEFISRHVLGEGRPVVLTDAIDRWKALAEWTPSSLRERFGEDFAIAPVGLFGDAARLTRISDYTRCMEDSSLELPGFWVRTCDGAPVRESPVCATPPYLMAWRAFHRHPELLAEIEPPPEVLEDCVLWLGAKARAVLEEVSGRELWSLYLSVTGCLSRLHQDYWSTHSYLAQIHGRKRVLLFSPNDSSRLYDGAIDPERPDLEAYPMLEGVTAFECIIAPGDLLFTPGGWWHHVRTLEASITVSHNYFDSSNLEAYLLGMASRIRGTAV